MKAALELPSLCLVADCSVVAPEELPGRVAAAVNGGVGVVQLRAKDLPGGRLLSLAAELMTVVSGRAILLVNERVDVASAAGAAGVQLGEAALPVAAARRLLPEGSLIGRSVHSAEGAEDAAADGADFLVVGTMYATGSHPGAAPAGPGLMRDVAAHCRLLLIGIGGITVGNVAEVMAAGASGIAVIRSILAADDPASAAREICSALHDAWKPGQSILALPPVPQPSAHSDRRPLSA